MKLKTMKIAIASLLALGAVGCGGGEEAPQVQTAPPSITLSTDELTINVGEYTTLGAVLYKLEGTIVWSSEDESVVAIVDGETLYGVQEGTTTVTATCNGVTASASISVESDVIQPEFGTFLSLSTYSLDMECGEAQEISAWLEYKNGAGQITDIKLSYLSSNTDIVEVVEGKITAKKSGSAIVYVATKYQGETFVNSVTVRVTGEDENYVPAGVAISAPTSVFVKVGEAKAIEVALKNGAEVIPASEYTLSARILTGATLAELVESDGGYSVEGLAAGNATVVVTITYKTQTFSASVHIGIS